MSENAKQPWDRTKWLLLIAILMVVEGFVFYAAMENSKSSSALGYISFAGTVTSIILAVLAIIYGFVQNYSQERKADTLSNEMSKVKDVIADLVSSKDALGGELNNFEELTESIKKLLNSHSQMKTSIDEVRTFFNGIGNEKSSSATTFNDKESFLLSFEKYQFILYSIWYGVLKQKAKTRLELQIFVMFSLVEFAREEHEKSSIVDQMYMLYVGVSEVLISFLLFEKDICVEDEEIISLSDEFSSFMNKLIAENLTEDTEKYIKLLEKNDSFNPPS